MPLFFGVYGVYNGGGLVAMRGTAHFIVISVISVFFSKIKTFIVNWTLVLLHIS